MAAGALILAIACAGCVNLKDDYPEIAYYGLRQAPSNLARIDTVPGTLQIRDFSIASEYDTEHIIAMLDNGKLHRYYYHRWLTGFADMATDFFVKRFSARNAFAGGVVKSASVTPPDYILEGQVLEMHTRNSELKDPGKSYVNLSIKINLIRRASDKVETTVLLSKVYEQKENRLSGDVSTVAEAYSKAVSIIADQVLVDVQKSILKEKIKK